MRFPFLDLAAVDKPLLPELIDAANEVLASGRYVGGPAVDHFERQLSAVVGGRHAVGVSNGLDALRLILEAYILTGRLSPGDEVLVPANTYVASFLAISQAGLTPVGVDINPRTMQIDAEEARRHTTPCTKALMTVHLYGRIAWDESLARLVSEHGLLVVEDCAQSIGAVSSTAGVEGNEHPAAGAIGHAAAFSFYPTKNIGAQGDAGAVVTADKTIADTVRALANYGSDRRYHNIYLGWNCRLDPIQAAMLSVKLRHLEAVTERRIERSLQYDRLIANPAVVKPEQPASARECVWHQYVVRVADRDHFRRYMSEQGVGTDVHYAVPPHKQPCYAGLSQPASPVTDLLAAQIVSLPISDSTTIDDIREISRIINNYKGPRQSGF